MIWEEVESIARHGDSYSIGLLCNRLLRKQGITVQVSRKEHNLIVVLTAKKLPRQRKYIKLLRQELKRLKIEAIATANVSGRKTGASGLTWTETIRLRKTTGQVKPAESIESKQSRSTNQKRTNLDQAEIAAKRKELKQEDRNSAQSELLDSTEVIESSPAEPLLGSEAQEAEQAERSIPGTSQQHEAIDEQQAILPNASLDLDIDIDQNPAQISFGKSESLPVELKTPDTISSDELRETKTDGSNPAVSKPKETKVFASGQKQSPRARPSLTKVGAGSMVGVISLASFGIGIAAERTWQVSDRLLSVPQIVRATAIDRFTFEQPSESIARNNKIEQNNNAIENIKNNPANITPIESAPTRAIAPTLDQPGQNQELEAPTASATPLEQQAIKSTDDSNSITTSDPENSDPIAKIGLSNEPEEITANQDPDLTDPATPIDPATQFTWQSAQLFMRQSGLLSTPKAPKITIKAVGDMIPGTNYPSFKLPEDRQILFAAIAEALSGSDILFGNFESTLTNHPYAAKDTSRPNVFAFRTPPDYAHQLKQIGFDVLSVANNHSFDFGDVGFLETIANMNNAGMAAVGQKGQILYLEVKGNRVAFIGFSYLEDHNSIHDLEAATALIKTATANAEIVIISVHAGAEGTDAMATSDRNEYFFGENRGNLLLFSRTMIDAGADLVLGHGPHVPRAMELYGDRLIAYSLGNFMGYQTLSSVAELGYSLILELELDQEGKFIAGQIIPVHIDANGIPKPDPQNRSIELIKTLTERDFPDTYLQVTATGELINQSPEAIANN